MATYTNEEIYQLFHPSEVPSNFAEFDVFGSEECLLPVGSQNLKMFQIILKKLKIVKFVNLNSNNKKIHKIMEKLLTLVEFTKK